LVCLLLLNGLRVSEAIDLTIADLDTERGHRVVRILGKGGRRRTAPLAPRTIAAVEAAIGGRTVGSIIESNASGPMNRHQATRAIRRLARAAGIAKPISPHSCRHTMITLSLEAGAPIHVVQDAAGHASPETTRRYDRARHALDGHAIYALAQQLG
jgi:integrase/recombinase XerD